MESAILGVILDSSIIVEAERQDQTVEIPAKSSARSAASGCGDIEVRELLKCAPFEQI